MRGFHLLVWDNGNVRVFGEDAETYLPQFEGNLSLWLLIRVWWWSKRKHEPHRPN